MKAEFDIEAANKHFAADCFNKAWELIDADDRSPEQDEQMIRLNQASMFHWTQRPDCTGKNLSIGYWQASRINAILGRHKAAVHYGQLALDYSADEAPFYKGYAHEALARAETGAGKGDAAREHLVQARSFADQVEDTEDRTLLLEDLDTIQW